MTAQISQRALPQIGIILCADIAQEALPARKYLLLQLNTLQSAFEYQIIPTYSDIFLETLASRKPLNRETVLADIPRFRADYTGLLSNEIRGYGMSGQSPSHYIIISRATFEDGYYVDGQNNVSILALGNWERWMAPPSLVEFVISIVLSVSIYALPSIQDLFHFGTKGCLFDFNADLSNARFMSLQGFVCRECRNKLETLGYAELAAELKVILEKKWLGNISECNSPAGIAAKLGYNLFLTKGLVPRWWERSLEAIEQEGLKELIKFIGAVLLAGSLIYFGLRR
jgi:hypothetical protein